MPTLVEDARETAAPHVLAEAALARVSAGVRAIRGAIVAGTEVLAARDVALGDMRDWLDRAPDPDTGDQLRADHDDPLFPMLVPLHADSVDLAGWLLLGPRPDGSLYGKDEREALSEVADPVAQPLAIASRRHADEAARMREVHGLKSRMSELEALVGQLVRSMSLAGEVGRPPVIGVRRRRSVYD